MRKLAWAYNKNLSGQQKSSSHCFTILNRPLLIIDLRSFTGFNARLALKIIFHFELPNGFEQTVFLFFSLALFSF